MASIMRERVNQRITMIEPVTYVLREKSSLRDIAPWFIFRRVERRLIFSRSCVRLYKDYANILLDPQLA